MALPLENARQLDQWGFNVLPAKVGGKSPQVPWRKFQDQRTSDRLHHWFEGKKPRNYWIATGRISGVVVLDCDTPAAEQFWRDRIGDAMDQTACVRTRKGAHYYFSIEPNTPVASWSRDDKEAGMTFDVRADGTGVIAPPSVHETGHVYEWVRSPDEGIVALPEALRRPEETDEDPGTSAPRSMLSELLSKPPRGVGGRNNWLARVAGHYAKHFRLMRDAYETHVHQAAAMLEPPLEPGEVTKLVESIWAKEQRKDEEGPVPDEANGYLVSGGDCILVQVRSKQNEEWVVSLEPWADFDIVALGVVEDEDANRTYDVEIRRRRHQDTRRALLPATKLARADGLAAWLSEFGVGILPPDLVWPKSGTVGERLRRYLEAQKPQHFRVVDSLGWHPGDGFVTHEGVIRKDGMHGFEKHKPDPRLRNWAPYRYGFVDEDVAREVLAEVLTFHDETVTAVYGAWWASCFLKPQIHQVTSQFPFMALEAPSESGKTTGFFSLMLQLNGNAQGQTNPTMAVLRDSLSAHQSGIVWIDDLSDTSHLMDLLRQATGEGSVGKKGEDRLEQQVVRLVAPICISGEALQLHSQKALVDRAVMLDVPSPTSRRSKRDPERLQWLDILELKKQWPDLTDMAGTMVRLALANEGLVESIPTLVPPEGGRWGDKIAVIRMGARLLSEMSGVEGLVERVENWVGQQEEVGNENSLTLKLLPRALAQTGWLRRPKGADGRWPPTPAFVDDQGLVWFSPQHLSTWWSEIRHGRIEVRTESEEALSQQARALGLGGGGRHDEWGKGRRRWYLDGDRNRKSAYWSLPPDLSEVVIARSRGETPRKGIHVEQHRLALAAYRDPTQDPGI